MEKKIEVKTSAGTICAEVSGVPEESGIYLYFIPKGTDVEIDLAWAMVAEDPNLRAKGQTEEDVVLRIWGDVRDECYTQRIDYKRSDVVDALIACGCDDIKGDEE